MTITTRLFTALFGTLVGTDEFGNRYYRRERKDAKRRGDRRLHETRWVIYKGKAEPSKVPAHWHGWLHYTTDVPPTRANPVHYAWQKEHIPNLTGTALAYLPPGHLLKGAERSPSASDYEPWTPG